MFGSFFFATARVAPKPHIIDILATPARNMISANTTHTAEILTIMQTLQHCKNVSESSQMLMPETPICLFPYTHGSLAFDLL